MQILQRNHHLRKYLSCHCTLSRCIHRMYHVEPNHHISPSVLSRVSCKYSSSMLLLFGDSVKLFQYCDRPGWCSFWGISSLTTVPGSTFFSLPFPPTFSAVFCCDKFMSVSFIEAFELSWKIVLRSFLKISSRFNR